MSVPAHPPHPTRPGAGHARAAQAADASVAAVLVNYFSAPDIAQAAQSVLQDAPGTQVLVVDNSANAAEHQRLCALLPPGAQALDAGANLGFGRGCNLGWQASKADHVFFVNPDVQLLGPGCIRTLVQALQADAGLAAVAPRQFLDPRCQWHLPPAWLPTALRAWVSERVQRDARHAPRLARAAQAENLRLWQARAPIDQRALSGSALMLRRSALAPDELPFDPQFFMYYEDSDLCLRLRRAGWRMAVVPAARAIHAWRNAPHKQPLMEQGGQVYFQKHWPAGAQHPWLARAAQQASRPASTLPAWQPLSQPWLDVPPAWHSGWLLEASPSPLLQPAIGLLAAGARASLPPAVLQAIAGATLYARLSPLPPSHAAPGHPSARWSQTALPTPVHVCWPGS